MSQSRVLVAGGSGRLGQMVLDQLLHAGAPDIIATTRTPQKLDAYASLGIDVRHADLDDPQTLSNAFQDADHLLLISTNDLSSGKRIQQHKNAIAAAKRAGVRRILYTSMPEPEASTAIPFSAEHVATERAIRESGLRYTILRVAWYAENPIELGLIPAALQTGTWLSSATNGRIAYVTRYDVARAAAAALASSVEESQTYEITGPAAMSAGELAASLSRTVGRPIQVREVDDETLGRELVSSGVLPQLAPMIVTTDANTRAGNFESISNAVLQLTGTPPRDFESFLRENKTRLLADAAH
ncbi:SDR family oxidoreductase [Acidipila sp. EB88]|uniref:SDR family oxidoreductase n=1 Tax=Acidipila sp. EB88 TaxID=2305226 RepID=UPI000F5E4936|nr:SDR family oxidoreductase [Acidipila sp. EB88]RRA49859.1 SDR family oxidoreductase [Acidipila sp. EB88]